MTLDPSPSAVVQRQLDAYNAKDIVAWLDTYAEDARQYELPGKLLAAGRGEIEARGVERFADPRLHARLITRAVMGPVVIDHEEVTRTFADGPGTLELICIYMVSQGRIQHASFVFGPRSAGEAATRGT